MYAVVCGGVRRVFVMRSLCRNGARSGFVMVYCLPLRWKLYRTFGAYHVAGLVVVLRFGQFIVSTAG